MTWPWSLRTAFSKSSGFLAMLAAVMPSKLAPPILALSLWQPVQYCFMVAICASGEAGATVAGAAVRMPAKAMAIRGIEVFIFRMVFIRSLSVRGKIGPQAFERAANEFIGVTHFGFEFLGRLGFDAFGGAAAFVDHLIQTIVDGAVHVDLRGDIGVAEQRTNPGNDPGVFVRDALDALETADNAPDPAAGPPIDRRPALSVSGVAHSEDILLWEVDVKIAVGVRRVGDVSVTDSGIESALVVEGFVGLGDFGKLFEFLPVPWPRDVLLQPEPRVFMGNDRDAGRAKFLVGAGLLRMPVRVEERVNFAAVGKRGDCLRQRVRIFGEPAVHENHAIGSRVGNHVPTRSGEEKKIIAQLRGCDLRRLREGVGHGQARCSCGLQEGPAR